MALDKRAVLAHEGQGVEDLQGHLVEPVLTEEAEPELIVLVHGDEIGGGSSGAPAGRTEVPVDDP